MPMLLQYQTGNAGTSNSGPSLPTDPEILSMLAASVNSINAERLGILPLNLDLLERRIHAMAHAGPKYSSREDSLRGSILLGDIALKPIKDFCCNDSSNCSTIRGEMAAHVVGDKGELHVRRFEPGGVNIASRQIAKLPREFRGRCGDFRQEIQFLHWVDNRHLLAAIMDTSESRPDRIGIIDTYSSCTEPIVSHALLANAPGLTGCEESPCIKGAASFGSPYCVAFARGHFEVFKIEESKGLPNVKLLQSFSWDIDVAGMQLSSNGRWLLLREENSIHLVSLAGARQTFEEAPPSLVAIKGPTPRVVFEEKFNESVCEAGFNGGNVIDVLLGESGLRRYEIPEPTLGTFSQLEFPNWPRIVAGEA